LKGRFDETLSGRKYTHISQTPWALGTKAQLRRSHQMTQALNAAWADGGESVGVEETLECRGCNDLRTRTGTVASPDYI
jgi:hypothetical protein